MEKPQLINFIAKVMEDSGFKVYKNFKEIIGKLEKNGLIEHSILVSNSSQEREEVYTNLRDLNLEEKISYFSTILVNKEVKKEVKVG